MQKIYHYTSIENLAMILDSRNIRFNRLDQMDDSNEHNFFSIGMNWSKYTYVSCWTENERENIPLWHMYTKGGSGVRIGVDVNFIDWDNQSSKIGLRVSNWQRPPSKSRAQTIIGTTWNFIHISKDSLNQGCYHKIKYVNEAKWSDEPIRIGNGKSFVDFSDSEYRDYVAIYKDKRWEFQDETRFIIFAVPGGLVSRSV